MKSAIACVLKKEGYISEYTEENTNPGKILTVTLKYHDGVYESFLKRLISGLSYRVVTRKNQKGDIIDE